MTFVFEKPGSSMASGTLSNTPRRRQRPDLQRGEIFGHLLLGGEAQIPTGVD